MADKEEILHQIELLKSKLAKSRAFIMQAEKQYKRSLAKLEKQKQAVLITKQTIENTKIKIANRIKNLQELETLVNGCK